MSDDQRRLACAARIYAVLLRLYPRGHRQAIGGQMLRTFADHYRDAAETGGEVARARAITFLLTTLALGLLLWVSAVEFNGVGGDHRLLGTERSRHQPRQS